MTSFYNYTADGNGAGGFWGPALDWNGASQAFRGGTMYSVPGGTTLFLVAVSTGQQPQTVGYSHRAYQDDRRQIVLSYQIGSSPPVVSFATIDQIPSVEMQLEQENAPSRTPFRLWALAADDGSWVHYYDTSRAP